MDLQRRQYLKAAAFGAASFILGAPILGRPFPFRDADQFKLFRHPLAKPYKWDLQTGEVLVSTLGEGGSILMHPVKRVVKKIYAQDAICVGGTKPFYNYPHSHWFFYESEKEVYTKLIASGSRYIPRDIAFNDEEQSITMPYLGEDLFTLLRRGQWQPREHHLQQIVDMANEYRSVGIFKRNICPSNLFLDSKSDRLIAIDFKYSVSRVSQHLPQEIQHHHFLLKSLDSGLPAQLATTFSDFSADLVNRYSQKSAEIYSTNFPPVSDHETRLRFLNMIKSAV